MRHLSLPNKLTFLRLLLTPVGVGILYWDQLPFNGVIATVIFVIGILTDAVDGYIARKYGLVTKLGTFLDPLCDKLILLSYFILLQGFGIYPLWLLIAFIGRELISDGFRSFALSQKVHLGSNIFGKLKTLLQSISVFCGLLYWITVRKELPSILPIEASLIGKLAAEIMVVAFVSGCLGLYFMIGKNASILKGK